MMEAFLRLNVFFSLYRKKRGQKKLSQPGLCYDAETVTIPLNMRGIKQKVNPLPMSTGITAFVLSPLTSAVADLSCDTTTTDRTFLKQGEKNEHTAAPGRCQKKG
jgi:hypothetical protein